MIVFNRHVLDSLSARLLLSLPLAATLLLSGCGGGGASSVAPPKIGTISYWAISNLYDLLPAGSTAVLNPTNGILTGQTMSVTPDVNSFVAIESAAAARNVAMLGYVPTGYFSHTCDIAAQCQTWARIEAQVQTYFQYMPNLSGIFFDETSPKVWSCNAFIAEFQQLRDIVHKYKPQAKIAFNAGTPDTCVVNAVTAGEIVVLFESNTAKYASQAAAIKTSTTAARAKGATPWHLIFGVASADLNMVIAQANSYQAALFYATDGAANGNTWGTLPAFWQQELTGLGY